MIQLELTEEEAMPTASYANALENLLANLRAIHTNRQIQQWEYADFSEIAIERQSRQVQGDCCLYQQLFEKLAAAPVSFKGSERVSFG